MMSLILVLLVKTINADEGVCKQQLRLRTIPIECIKQTKPDTPAWIWLQQLCISNLQDLDLVGLQITADEVRILPEKCRDELKRKLRHFVYKNEIQYPTQAWVWRKNWPWAWQDY